MERRTSRQIDPLVVVTGVLAPGTYTFSGGAGTEGPNVGWPTGTVAIPMNAQLTVAPEPTVVPLAGMLLLCARPSRRRPNAMRVPSSSLL